MDESNATINESDGTDLDNVSALVERIHRETNVPLLVNEVAVLRVKKDVLEVDNARLTQRIHELQEQLALLNPAPVNQSYSFEQFMQALSARLGRTYGSRTDYANATRQTPGSRVVSTDEIQRWQKEGRVPEDVYVQVSWLHYAPRSSPKSPDWATEELDHLVTLYHGDPHQSNAVLAGKCSEEFRRSITESAIRGQIYRLGKAGRLPAHRPK